MAGPGTLDRLFDSGAVIDLALGLLAVEAVILGIIRLRGGRGIPVVGLLLTILSGAAILLAWRASLAGAGWLVIGPWLGVALLAHLADLGRRWRR
jgi:hypothetical protein